MKYGAVYEGVLVSMDYYCNLHLKEVTIHCGTSNKEKSFCEEAFVKGFSVKAMKL